jgi:hypothetical protein
VPSFFCFKKKNLFFVVFLCVSQQSTSKVHKHHKNFLRAEGSPCQKLLAEKVEEKKLFPFVFSHRFIFIAFLAVSLHEEPENTTISFSKIKPENLKKSQKR